MRDTSACSYADGNDPAEKKNIVGESGEICWNDVLGKAVESYAPLDGLAYLEAQIICSEK